MKAIIRTMAYPLSRCQFLLLATAPCSLLRVMLNGRVAPYRWWYILVARCSIIKVENWIIRKGLLWRTIIEISLCLEITAVLIKGSA